MKIYLAVIAGLLPASAFASGGGGRLICSATTTAGAVATGCSDGNVVTAQSDAVALRVVRSGSALAVELRDLEDGTTWNGAAMLRFPPGGTGTRARVFIEPPGFALFSYEFDTLLRCS